MRRVDRTTVHVRDVILVHWVVQVLRDVIDVMHWAYAAVGTALRNVDAVDVLILAV